MYFQNINKYKHQVGPVIEDVRDEGRGHMYYNRQRKSILDIKCLQYNKKIYLHFTPMFNFKQKWQWLLIGQINGLNHVNQIEHGTY